MVKIDIAVAVLTDVVDREIAEVSVAFLGGVAVARSIFIVDWLLLLGMLLLSFHLVMPLVLFFPLFFFIY